MYRKQMDLYVYKYHLRIYIIGWASILKRVKAHPQEGKRWWWWRAKMGA